MVKAPTQSGAVTFNTIILLLRIESNLKYQTSFGSYDPTLSNRSSVVANEKAAETVLLSVVSTMLLKLIAT